GKSSECFRMTARVMNGPKATSALSPFDSQLRTLVSAARRSYSCQELTYVVQQTNCVAPSITAAPNSGGPGRHVRRVRRSVGAGAEEPVVVIGVNVVRLHHPHEMHRISAAGKAAVSVEDVVANRLGAREAFCADLDRARAMLVL